MPEWIDIHLLQTEVKPSNMTALEAVLDETRKEIERLEDLQLRLLERDPDSPKLLFIDEKLEVSPLLLFFLLLHFDRSFFSFFIQKIHRN